MRHWLAVLVIVLSGCGSGRFQAKFTTNSPIFSISGFVTFVEFTTFQNSPFVVTAITFFPEFSPQTTLIFCGDLTQQLFTDDFATVNFTQGPNCATALTIFIDCC